MRKAIWLSAILLVFTGASLFAQQIRGDYIESRSTDVYVAQCFANGQAGLLGHEALLAWHVRQGSWHGVKLDGLTVAAAVRARATLGDPYGQPYPAEAVLMVDDAANAAQRQALIALAQHEGGKLLAHVVHVDYLPVVLDVPADPEQGYAVLRAGNLVTIRARPLRMHDRICGNETDFYPPLTQVEHATSAVAATDQFHGDGLGTQWSRHGWRSVYIANFTAGGTTLAAASKGPVAPRHR